MRTLAPGSYREIRYGGVRRRVGGFTLVEMLLVLLIAGILSVAVLPTLSFRKASAKDEAERLASLIEHAEVMATSLGTPLGLEISAGQYEFLRWTGTWTAMESGNLFGRHPLADGIAMEALADLSSGQAAPHIIRFPPTGYPATFRVRVTGSGNAWLVSGDLAGRVRVENRDSAP